MASITVVTGDVVYLKSGGPAMTVMSISGTIVKVGWIYEGDLRTETFQIDMLTKTNPKGLG